MAYRTPSHEKINKPGDEGSCPSMPTESVNGKDFPNGERDKPVNVSGELHFHKDEISHSGGGSSDPTPAMPGA